MNKHAYKVIFNKTTGRMDVVSEIVCSDGKSIGGVEGNQGSGSWLNQLTQFLFKPLTFALMLSLGTAQILPAQAQVIADPNAPKTQQATILPTASGATQINIQKPTEGGVSMNQYKQFDTQSNGTILNNSRTNTNTQTAGWIQGNPWLAGGTARIIVNQVNSSNPTHLTGNIEIAGNKAEVIISNPVGILVNGTTFLNASRTTLSTGKPIIENGLLMGHQVDQGQISIEGQGLNVQGSHYTDLLARAVKINAGIWGNNLAITTGVNRINADNSQATAGTSTGATPTVAIDTSALGGMYAGKITLVGTEKGVGVNNAGQIAASAGNVSIDINGMLSNSGTINANLDASGAAKTQIKSTHLKNTGTISSQGDTDIQTASLSNSATIAAGREAKLSVKDLNNSTGTINGQRIDITTNSLNNTQGKIQQTGAQAIALEAGSINNANKGLIGYEPLDAGTGSGTGGTGTGAGTTPPPSTATGGGSSTVVQPAPVALADGQIKVTTSINNDAGQITANGGINLTAKNGLENHATLNLNKLKVTGDSLDNSSGSITTAQTDVATNSVNNVAGKIQTYGNSTISANQIDNTTGLIRSDLANKLTASSINNSNTQGTEQGIEGGTVAIQSNTLNNTKGAIRSKVDLTAEGMGLVNGSIDNTQGLMSSNGTLNLKDNDSNTLAITNTAGQIISDGNNKVQAKSLTGDGTVTSNADLSITLNDDFNNAGTTTAVNNLTLTTAGNLTNSTALKAGSSATIKAQNIDNLANAEISSAKTQMTATDTLNNRGLIDGGDTLIKSSTVSNIGTGRIYGDHIAIGATTLNNLDETVNGTKTAATIAARSQLDIGAQTINNREHATLFADGTLNIGGSLDASNLATGQANELNNESATVESTGDMNLSIKQINNRNMHFASEIQVVKQEGVSQVQGTLGEQVNGVAGAGSVSPLYSVDGSARTNLPSLGGEYGGNYTLNTQNNVYITPDQSNYLVTPEGGYREWNLRDYIRTTSESVVTSSDPSKITVGGNLTLATTELRNENSQVIVGGALQGDAQNIKNVETLGQRIVADNGTILYNARDYDKGRDEPAVWSDPYNTTHPTQSINISTALVQEHIAPTSTNTDAGTRDLSNLVMSTDGSNQIRTAPVNTNMPNSSLFTIDPNNSGYFIQTDPRFADYKNWLSSDWMLGALKLDPTTTHKRLGDGYYEQKLIREQVAQLTGRRYLSGQNNDETQYQALMQSGVTFAGQYNLRPGIALTAEQMAHLTSDIVWLVEQEVTLPNGNKVKALIPKVYVAVKPGDIDGSGSLLSANRINLNLTGDLNNSGTISGRTVTQITAENLNNLGGRITADQLNLKANSDINNVGGIIDANTSANLQAGRDINVTTTTASGATGYGSATIIDRVAGIYVGTGANELIGQNTNINSLTLQAGRDVNLIVAQIDNAGTGGTRIDATNGNLNLATVTTSESERIYRDARNGFSTSSSNEIGSSINGTGNVALSAGKDVNARAADVNSQTGVLSVQAGNDINIKAGTSTRDTVVDAYQKQSGFLSSKKTTEHQDSSIQTSVASNFTGATVALNAGHDANITGSNVISDTLTSISAGNDVNILAATETSSSSNFKEVTKSGLMGTGGIGFMVGKTQNSTDTDNTTVTHNASMIASNQGDVNITAGKTLNVKGSDAQAGHDLTATAQTINVVAETDSYAQTTEQKSKSSGLTVSLSGTVGNAANGVIAAVQQSNAASDRGNDRLAAAYNTKAALTAAQAAQSVYQDITDVSAANKATQGSMIGVSVSVGSSKSQSNSASQTTVAQGSNLTAGNHLALTATGDGTKGADGYANNGDINIQGSSVSAKVVDLNAARDVNLISAANTNTETSSNSSSGWAVGANIGVSASGSMGISVFANVNKGKGNANGIGVTHTETQINATDTLNINSGRDTNLVGAQAHGNTVNADIGRDLTITSEQDSSNYNSKQTNMSAGVEIPVYGVGSASASFNMSKQKIDSNYNSVNEQSGIYAGNGGFNIKVDGHTQLNGGAIVSTSPVDKNTFNTGSLGVSHIDNTAAYKATNSGIGISTGSLTDIAKGALMAQIPQALNSKESDSSTTQSAISPANVTIGGQAATPEQLKDVATTANANSLTNQFDVQMVQDQMALASTVGDIGALATNVVSTAMQRDAYVANDAAMYASEQSMKANDPAAYADYVKNPSAAVLLNYEFNQKMDSDSAFAQQYGATYYTTPESERAAYVQSLTTQGVVFGSTSAAAVNLHQTQAQYGIGSPFGRAAQALTGLATGIASGNMAQGVSAATAPYLTSVIGKYFDDMELGPDGKRYPTTESTTGRLLAHAAAGAAVAYISGNSAASGATGAVSGETMAIIVHQQLYDAKPVSELTQAEKENIRAVATLASGLAGALQGGSFESAATSAAAGYNAAVNNEQGSNSRQQNGDDSYGKTVSKQVSDCVAKGDADCVSKYQADGMFTETYWRTQYNAAQTNKRNMDTAVRVLNSCINGGGSAETCAAKMQQQANGVRTLFTLLPLVGEGEAIKILFSGTDINGEEASRWWGAFGIVTAGYGQKARILGKVDDALKAEVKATEKLVQQGDNAHSVIVQGGGLAAHEFAGGHLIARHIGQSEADMAARLAASPGMDRVSNFASRATAEKAVSEVLDANQSAIQKFLSGSSPKLEIDGIASSSVGTVLVRGASTSVPTNALRVVIKRDPTSSLGYYILTGFPTP